MTQARQDAMFTQVGQAYSATQAQLVVHVGGTARQVSLSANHAATQRVDGTAWAAGDTGSDVFFPNVDVPWPRSRRSRYRYPPGPRPGPRRPASARHGHSLGVELLGHHLRCAVARVELQGLDDRVERVSIAELVVTVTGCPLRYTLANDDPP